MAVAPLNLTPGPAPGPLSPPRELEFGLTPIVDAQMELGTWASFRYRRGVEKFFQRVDEKAFYEGLGGVAARHLGDISPETLVDETTRIHDEGQAIVEDHIGAHDSLQDARDGKEAAMAKLNQIADDKLSGKLSRQEAAEARDQAEAELVNFMRLENTAKEAKKAAPKAVRAKQRELDAVSHKRVNPLADEQPIPAVNRRERRDEKKVTKLVNEIKPAEQFVRDRDNNRTFMEHVTRNVEITRHWKKDRIKRLKAERERGENDAEYREENEHLPNDVRLSEEIEHLEHMGSHGPHEAYRRIRRNKVTGEWERPSIDRSKNYVRNQHRAESARVELNRITRNDRLAGRIKRHKEKLVKQIDLSRAKRTNKQHVARERVMPRIRTIHDTRDGGSFNSYVRTGDNRFVDISGWGPGTTESTTGPELSNKDAKRLAKQVNIAHVNSPFNAPISRTVYDIRNNRPVLMNAKPRKSKQVADISGWM